MGPTPGVTGSVYHRSYAPLRMPVINAMWRTLTVVVSFVTVLQTLPWQTAKAIAPGGVKNTMMEIESTVLNTITPFCNFWQDFWYKVYSLVDTVACTVRTNLEHFIAQFSRDMGTLSNRVLSILENRTSVLQDLGIHAFPTLFNAGLFTPNAMTTVPGMAMSAAKDAARGVGNRVARMGDAISTHPAGATHNSLAQGMSNVY